MSNKKLHPSVQQFKEFVKNNPKIISDVRKGNATWQELFEEWYLLGEDDSRWDEYKEQGESTASSQKGEGKKEWLPQIMGAIKNMDPNQLQGHITNLNHALGAIQGLISQFQGGSSSNSQSSNQGSQPQHPFQFRKD